MWYYTAISDFADNAIYILAICTLVVHKDLSKEMSNFKALCTGEKGVSETTGVRLLHYNALMHGVVPGGWIVYGLGRGN